MILAHIADIHIRNTERHKEYKIVFDRLFESILEHKVDAIFLLGDIFHSKTKLSPESITLARYLFLKLHSISKGPTILIPGNHDLSVTNLQRMDALTPIVEALEYGKILTKSSNEVLGNDFYYLLASGNFKVSIANKEVGLSHYSLIDPNNWHKVMPSDIGLFHGVIGQATTDVGFNLGDTGHPISLINKNKFGMLGDVHKFQQIDKNIFFVGSLVTQNFGESVHKGWVKWDINIEKGITNSVELIEIPNDYAYYTIVKNEDGSYPTCSEIPKHPVVRVFVPGIQLTKSEIIDIQQEVIEKFDPSEIRQIQGLGDRIKMKSFNNIEVNIDIDDIQNPVTQNKYITEYYANVLDSDTIENILQLNNKYQSMLVSEEISRNVNWELEILGLSNFSNYGEGNEIDFRKFKGVTGIIGDNKIGKCVDPETEIEIEFDEKDIIKKLGFLPDELK